MDLTGVDFLASPCAPSAVSAIRKPKLPLLPLWEKGAGGSHRGRFFGKPLRAISRFSHQNAQTPPSSLVGEGDRWISQGWIFWQAPARHLPFQPSERPNSPFSPCGRRGQGDEGKRASGCGSMLLTCWRDHHCGTGAPDPFRALRAAGRPLQA